MRGGRRSPRPHVEPRWGWHRLDPEVARQLVRSSGVREGDLVLDIGAGDGRLTGALAASGARVLAIERHPQRLAVLGERFAHVPSVRVVHADAADLRLPRRPFHVVANPPFAVTSALLTRLLHPGTRMISAHVVLQEQAARRWCSTSAPGARRWQREFDVALGAPVRRRQFSPPPPVDARVLVIRRRPGRRVERRHR